MITAGKSRGETATSYGDRVYDLSGATIERLLTELTRNGLLKQQTMEEAPQPIVVYRPTPALSI